MKSQLEKYIGILLVACFFLFSATSYADPPSRVARISIIEGGAVTILPNQQNDWSYVAINRPLTIGDRLWIDTSAHAELQIDGAAIRIGSETDLSIFNLDNTMAQFALNQGTINLYISSIDPSQIIEIDTPNLSFTTSEPGDYRIDVTADSTRVSVRTGQGIVYGEGETLPVNANQSLEFSGTNLTQDQDQMTALLSEDEFDQWCASLNSRMNEKPVSTQYVSEDVVGASDLDIYGQWQSNADYGNVWFPSNVSDDWAPYRDGSWFWQDPWGWTWVDNQPWGFAPFHYGRWIYIDGHWGWIPPVGESPVYAPALVVFFGIGDVGVAISLGGFSDTIGWFPLGPGDIYVPPYTVSQNYFTNINITNININPVYINNYYQHPVKLDYHNWKNDKALTVVPVASFQKGDRVNKVLKPVTSDMLSKMRIKEKPGIANLPNTITPAKHRPPANVMSRKVYVKTLPPSENMNLRKQGLSKENIPSYQKIRNIAPVKLQQQRSIQPEDKFMRRPMQNLQIPKPPQRELRPIQRRNQQQILPQPNQENQSIIRMQRQQMQQQQMLERQQRMQQQNYQPNQQMQQIQQRRQMIEQRQQQRMMQQRQQQQQTIEPQGQQQMIQQQRRQQIIEQQRQRQQEIQQQRQQQMLEQRQQQQQMIQQQRQQQMLEQRQQQQQMIQQQRQQQIIEQQRQRQQEIQQQRQQQMLEQRQQQQQMIQQQRQQQMLEQRQQQQQMIQQQRQQQIIEQQRQQQQMIQQQRQQQIIEQQRQQQQMIQQQRQQQIIEQQRQQQQMIQQQQQQIIEQQKQRQQIIQQQKKRLLEEQQ